METFFDARVFHVCVAWATGSRVRPWHDHVQGTSVVSVGLGGGGQSTEENMALPPSPHTA